MMSSMPLPQSTTLHKALPQPHLIVEVVYVARVQVICSFIAVIGLLRRTYYSGSRDVGSAFRCMILLEVERCTVFFWSCM